MVHRKKILVLESEKLLAAGILSLLAGHAELDVRSTTIHSLFCVDEPDSQQPDVVILDEELLAANLSATIQLADRHPRLRLIVFRLTDNRVHVFDKQIVRVRQASDFLELL